MQPRYCRQDRQAPEGGGVSCRYLVNLIGRRADKDTIGGISGAPMTKPTPPSDHIPLGRRCACCDRGSADSGRPGSGAGDNQHQPDEDRGLDVCESPRSRHCG